MIKSKCFRWLRYSAIQYSIIRFHPRNYITYYQFRGPAYVYINVRFSFVFSNYAVSTILLVMIAKNIHQV